MEVYQGTTLLTNIDLAYYSISATPIQKVINTVSNSDIILKLIFMDCFGTIELKDIKITPYYKNEQIVCTNYNINSEERYIENNNIWYKLNSTPTKITYGNNNTEVEVESISYQDLIDTVRNYHLNNNFYDVWYNNKRNIIRSVSNVKIYSSP